MGNRDRRPRSHPRADLARLLCRDRGPARAGGDRAARGHAGRARRGAGCAALRAGRDLAGLIRHEPAAEDALGSRAAGHAARRQPLVGDCMCRGGSFRRALCAARRDLVPARAPVRSDASLLRGRSRDRAESETPGAGERRRPDPAGGRPPRRDAFAGLHAPRYSGAAADLRARPSRRGRARPGLPATPRDQRHADRVCRRARGLAAAQRAALAWRNAGGACRLPGLDRQADHGAGRRQSRRDRRGPARDAAARCGDLQRCRQLLGLGASLSPLPPLRHPAGADLGLDGLRRAGRDRDEAT